MSNYLKPHGPNLAHAIFENNEQHNSTVSVGFIYDIGHNFLVESWMSFPSERGKEDVLTVKLNYVIKF